MNPFDEKGVFESPHHDRLRGLAVRGAGVTAFAQSLGFAIQLISTVVLARLLAPADFGLVTMVTTFSLLLMNFGTNGLSQAAVQRKELDHDLASNLFWINIGIGVVLTIAFASAGGLLARFYGDPRVAGVTIAMSATIFLTSISVQHLALLKRGMRFTAISTNDIFARVFSVVVAIWLAWAAWGYWALVAAAVAQPFATCIGAWVVCRWIPSLPRRGADTGPMVRFAMNTYGHFSLNYMTRNLDNLLVGWFFGPQALGFYKKAYDLCVLPAGQLSDPLVAVAVPTLSRVAGDPERYRRYVLRALSTLALAGMGLGAALALVGKDLIFILLGPRWDESGRIFTFFAPGMGALLVYTSYSWILLSLGRPDRLLRWGIIELASFGSLFLLGTRLGPQGVALAWVVAAWTLMVPALSYAGKPAGIRPSAIVNVLWRYVAASALAGVISAWIVSEIPYLATASLPLSVAGRMVFACALFSMVYLAAVVLLHRGREPIYEAATLLREMLPSNVSKLFT
jgi:O-antigen/teichoic acid export membrane protein